MPGILPVSFMGSWAKLRGQMGDTVRQDECQGDRALACPSPADSFPGEATNTGDT